MILAIQLGLLALNIVIDIMAPVPEPEFLNEIIVPPQVQVCIEPTDLPQGEE